MMKINFYEFIYVWFKLQNLSVPRHQRKIAEWLSTLWQSADERQGLLMAFRNSGKSTVVGLFCAWVLYRESATRILVMAADHALAKKMGTLNRNALTNGRPISSPSAAMWNCGIRPCWPRE